MESVQTLIGVYVGVWSCFADCIWHANWMDRAVFAVPVCAFLAAHLLVLWGLRTTWAFLAEGMKR